MLRVSGAHCLLVLDSPFGADGDRHLVNAGRIEGGGQPDRLGKTVVAVRHATPCKASLHQS